MTLSKLLTEWRWHQCRKHNLHDDADAYVEEEINNLSQYEFMQELSHALEEILSNH